MAGEEPGGTPSTSSTTAPVRTRGAPEGKRAADSLSFTPPLPAVLPWFKAPKLLFFFVIINDYTPFCEVLASFCELTHAVREVYRH